MTATRRSADPRSPKTIADPQGIEQRQVARRHAFAADLATGKGLLLHQAHGPSRAGEQNGAAVEPAGPASDDDGVK